jgi:hypothetical protein
MYLATLLKNKLGGGNKVPNVLRHFKLRNALHDVEPRSLQIVSVGVGHRDQGLKVVFGYLYIEMENHFSQ